MTKQDFLIEVTLRLASTRLPNEKASDIATMAEELTEKIFKNKGIIERKEGQFWSEDIDMAPIESIIGHIERQGHDIGGYAYKLTNIFKDNGIKTVGDLLRLGKFSFKKLNKVGQGSYSRVDDALRELYDIKGW